MKAKNEVRRIKSKGGRKGGFQTHVFMRSRLNRTFPAILNIFFSNMILQFLFFGQGIFHVPSTVSCLSPGLRERLAIFGGDEGGKIFRVMGDGRGPFAQQRCALLGRAVTPGGKSRMRSLDHLQCRKWGKERMRKQDEGDKSRWEKRERVCVCVCVCISMCVWMSRWGNRRSV